MAKLGPPANLQSAAELSARSGPGPGRSRCRDRDDPTKTPNPAIEKDVGRLPRSAGAPAKNPCGRVTIPPRKLMIKGKKGPPIDEDWTIDTGRMSGRKRGGGILGAMTGSRRGVVGAGTGPTTIMPGSLHRLPIL